MNELKELLDEELITNEEYERAKRVWNKFKCQSFKNYHDLYLKLDILLLADVFENFRRLSLKEYGLDPLYYLTAPGLAYDALLKKTDVRLDLIYNPDIYKMIEKSIRGGLSVISHRHAVANNKYMGAKYNENEDSNYLIYLDMNNLYGGAMSRPLPTHDFYFVHHSIVAKDNFLTKVLNTPTDSSIGCILEIDAYWPDHLHDKLNDYPPLPDNIISNIKIKNK